MNDAEYFAARESAERVLADQASNAKVRDIHLKLADKYAALAAREKQGQPAQDYGGLEAQA